MKYFVQKLFQDLFGIIFINTKSKGPALEKDGLTKDINKNFRRESFKVHIFGRQLGATRVVSRDRLTPEKYDRAIKRGYKWDD